jgi:hypothetical protein
VAEASIGESESAGRLLVTAAAAFWLGWLLMPAVGITDAARILGLVAGDRTGVVVSSVLHLVAAAALALAVPGLARWRPPDGNRFVSLAASLLAVGACAVAADAIFHFAAYEMAQPGADREEMTAVLQRMQSRDLPFVLPGVLSFFLGAGALAGGASRARLVSRWNPRLHGLALATAGVGGPLLAPRGAGRAVGLVVLGLVSASLAWVGVALARSRDA